MQLLQLLREHASSASACAASAPARHGVHSVQGGEVQQQTPIASAPSTCTADPACPAAIALVVGRNRGVDSGLHHDRSSSSSCPAVGIDSSLHETWSSCPHRAVGSKDCCDGLHRHLLLLHEGRLDADGVALLQLLLVLQLVVLLRLLLLLELHLLQSVQGLLLLLLLLLGALLLLQLLDTRVVLMLERQLLAVAQVHHLLLLLGTLRDLQLLLLLHMQHATSCSQLRALHPHLLHPLLLLLLGGRRRCVRVDPVGGGEAGLQPGDHLLLLRERGLRDALLLRMLSALGLEELCLLLLGLEQVLQLHGLQGALLLRLAAALVGRVGLHGGELARNGNRNARREDSGGVVGRRDHHIRMDSKAEPDLARSSSSDHLLPTNKARRGPECSLRLIHKRLAKLLEALGWHRL